jgi:hypothetical protein
MARNHSSGGGIAEKSMTKMQALYSFFSSFGIPAYEENAIYAADVVLPLPYITYSVSTASFLSGDIPISASIWYRSASWKEISEKADAVSARLSNGGVHIPCDDGFVWLKRSNGAFAQMTGDPSDKFVKRAILNISAEYFTTN